MFICSSTVLMWRSQARTLFLTYQGASAIVCSARFCTLSTLMTFESEAVAHICMQYVNERTTIDLYSNILLLRLSSLVPLSIQFSFRSLARHVAVILVLCCLHVRRLSKIKPKYWARADCGMTVNPYKGLI